MKRPIALLLAILLFAVPALAAECACTCGADAGLTGNTALIFNAVKNCQDMPKSARVISAQDFICKMSDTTTARYLLIHVSQTEFNANHFGTCSQIILVNMDTEETWTYANVDMNAFPDVIQPENAHIALFNSYDSYLQGYNDFIWWADGEIVTPVSDADIEAINSALDSHFA